MSAQEYWNQGQGQYVGDNQQPDYHSPSPYPQHQQYSSAPSDNYGYPPQSNPYDDQSVNAYSASGADSLVPHARNSSQQYDQSQPFSPPPDYQSPPAQHFAPQIDNSGYPPQPHTQYDYVQSDVYGQEAPYAYPSQPMPQEGERGVMGALAGAAAGGYAGHKVDHGFIGAIGGAVVGSKLEDHYKDKKKKEKKSKFGHFSRRSSSSSSSSSDDDKKIRKYHMAAAAAAGAGVNHGMHHPHQQPIMAGNFTASCQNMTLDRDHDLIASCRSAEGTWTLSSISLNNFLTNDWGNLRWARGGNFAPSSRNIRLVDNGHVLEAELGTGDGGWRLNRIRLDERISNNNGDLIFLDY